MNGTSASPQHRVLTIGAASLLGLALIAGASWIAWRMESKAEPAPSQPVAKAPAAQPAPLARAEPASVPGTRQGDTIRGSLVVPDSSERRLTETELASLSREQLAEARREIYARHDATAGQQQIAGEAQLSEIEAANLRLIEAVEKSR